MTDHAVPRVPAPPASSAAFALDRTGELAAARLDAVTQAPKRFARQRERLQRWLGVVDVAGVVKEITTAFSLFANELQGMRQRRGAEAQDVQQLRRKLDEAHSLILSATDRLAYYEQVVPQLRKGRAGYDQLVRSIMERSAARPDAPTPEEPQFPHLKMVPMSESPKARPTADEVPNVPD